MPISAAILDFDNSGLAGPWFVAEPPAIVEWVKEPEIETRIRLSEFVVIPSTETVFLTGNDQRMMHTALIASGKIRQIIDL